MADGRITDDLRIRLAARDPHLAARPGAAQVTAAATWAGPRASPTPRYAMAPVRRRLSRAARRRRAPTPSRVELMENLRFDPREEAGDLSLRRASWSPGRTSSSTTPSAPPTGPTPRSSAHPAAAVGRRPASWPARSRSSDRLAARRRPRPFVAVLGGSKVSDKLGVIEALLDRVDTLLVGGGMCFTFLAAQGHSIGESLFEADQVDTCRPPAGLRPRHPHAQRPDRAQPRWHASGRAGRRAGRSARWAPTCPTDGSASTSARGRPPRSQTPSPRPAPSSGTAPWACSRTRASRPGPGRWPRRWPPADGFTVVGGGDSAAAAGRVRPGRPDRPRLDRRRGVARVPRARRPARAGRPAGGRSRRERGPAASR